VIDAAKQAVISHLFFCKRQLAEVTIVIC